MANRNKFSPNRRYPTVPTVTADPRSHTVALQALIEGVNIGQRRAGSVNDSFVRVGELVDIGLIELVGDSLKLSNFGGIGEAPDDGNQYARQSGAWTVVSGGGGGIGVESDPIFTAHVAYSITAGDIANWDAAYGWGDHASAGYLTSVVAANIDAEASAAGYVLTSDGAGNAAWEEVVGGGSTAATSSGARVYRAASAQSVPDATNTAVTFDTEVQDDGDYADLATNNDRLTVPATGWYIVTGYVRWDSNTTGGRNLWISKNGDLSTKLDGASTLGTTTVNMSQRVSAVLYLTAGDYIQLVVRQSSTATRTLDLSFDTPWFAIHRLSAGGAIVSYLGPKNPDNYPITPDAQDDEFDAAALDTGLWTWWNQGTSTWVQSAGRGVLTVQTGSTNRGVEQAVSGATWKYRCKVSGYMTQGNYSSFGMYIRDSVGGKIIQIGVYYDTVTFAFDDVGYQVQRWTNPTTWSATIGNQVFSDRETIVSRPHWLEIEYDGTTLYFRYSYDGVAFRTLASELPATFLGTTPTHVGLYAYTSTTPAPVAAFDWFRKIGGSYDVVGGSDPPSSGLGVAIDALSDVDTTTAAPLKGSVLVFDGTNWVPYRGILGPDGVTGAPDPNDDEFDYGSDIDTTGARFSGASPWTRVVTSGTIITEFGRSCFSSYADTGDANAVYGIPVSGASWAYECKMLMLNREGGIFTFNNYNTVGVAVYDSVSTRWTRAGPIHAAAIDTEKNRWTNTSFNSAANGPNPTSDDLFLHKWFYIRVRLDAGTLYWHMSMSGVPGSWVFLFSETIASWIVNTPTHVGFSHGNGGASYQCGVSVDYFRKVE